MGSVERASPVEALGACVLSATNPTGPLPATDPIARYIEGGLRPLAREFAAMGKSFPPSDWLSSIAHGRLLREVDVDRLVDFVSIVCGPAQGKHLRKKVKTPVIAFRRWEAAMLSYDRHLPVGSEWEKWLPRGIGLPTVVDVVQAKAASLGREPPDALRQAWHDARDKFRASARYLTLFADELESRLRRKIRASGHDPESDREAHGESPGAITGARLDLHEDGRHILLDGDRLYYTAGERGGQLTRRHAGAKFLVALALGRTLPRVSRVALCDIRRALVKSARPDLTIDKTEDGYAVRIRANNTAAETPTSTRRRSKVKPELARAPSSLVPTSAMAPR